MKGIRPVPSRVRWRATSSFSGRLTEEVAGLRQDLQTSSAPKWKTKPFYTVNDLGKMLGRSSYTIRRWIREGKINALKLNNGGPKDHYIIEHEEVEELILRADTHERTLSLQQE